MSSSAGGASHVHVKASHLIMCEHNNKLAELLSVGAGEGSIICHTGCCHKHIPHHIPYLVIKSLGRRGGRGREVASKGENLRYSGMLSC